jgi:hypothetical protein
LEGADGGVLTRDRAAVCPWFNGQLTSVIEFQEAKQADGDARTDSDATIRVFS